MKKEQILLKNYITEIKKNRKKNKNFKGSVVETVSGKLFVRWGSFSQNVLDKKALEDCRKAGEIDCLVRFRTLKKNLKYNRFAKYIDLKKA